MNRPGRNGGTLRSYEKGKSGNPAGRPLKSSPISQLLAELGNFTDLEIRIEASQGGRLSGLHQLRYSTDGWQAMFALLAVQLLMRAAMGDINALKIVLDRTEGRTRPPVRFEKPERPSVQ